MSQETTCKCNQTDGICWHCLGLHRAPEMRVHRIQGFIIIDEASNIDGWPRTMEERDDAGEAEHGLNESPWPEPKPLRPPKQTYDLPAAAVANIQRAFE